MQEHKWKNLQRIPRPFHIEDREVYTETALAFRDRLAKLTLILNLQEYSTTPGQVLRKLLSDLSTFTCLKHLMIEKDNGPRLEEVDEILNSFPNLTSFAVHRRHALFLTNQHHSDITENTWLSDKISLFNPKINCRKLDFSFTIDGGDETLCYIMHALPNLKAICFNPNFYRTNLVYSNPVLKLFLRYSLNRITIDAKYLACDDIFSLLPLFWQSDAYKAVNKTDVSLSIEEIDSFETLHTRKPYIGMSSKHEVTVTFVKFGPACSFINLIANVGSYLTTLKTGPMSLCCTSCTETRTTSAEAFLVSIFEYFPLLKRLEGSFHTLQFYKPKVSVHNSMEKLVLICTFVHPTALE
ncbi:hypothetical protein MFLAVUS_004821 [Mucor flavus]|uniref:DUF38 domain-containing protein n=1 Tax=Mucor flavus TaxID=439312 RepID=A0ABP9YWZ5_9FUNG